jgi:hypothetical protein
MVRTRKWQRSDLISAGCMDVLKHYAVPIYMQNYYIFPKKVKDKMNVHALPHPSRCRRTEGGVGILIIKTPEI